MAAKAMIPVEALPCVHLAPCMALGFGRHTTVRRYPRVSTLIHLAPCMALGFGRHTTVRRYPRVSTLIHRSRGRGPLLQGP